MEIDQHVGRRLAGHSRGLPAQYMRDVNRWFRLLLAREAAQPALEDGQPERVICGGGGFVEEMTESLRAPESAHYGREPSPGPELRVDDRVKRPVKLRDVRGAIHHRQVVGIDPVLLVPQF